MAEHKTTNVVSMMAVAGIAGVGIGLLFAPRSGRETRKKVQQAADDMRQQAGEGLDRAKATLLHNSDKMRAWKQHLAHKATEESRQADQIFGDSLTSTDQELKDFNNSILRNWEEEV